MGISNSGDHIDEDHIHTDITIWSIETPQRSTALGRSCYRLLRGGGGLKHVLLDPNPSP